MPELPEVEVARCGIEPHLLGQRIAGVTVRNPNLRWPIPDNLKATLTGQTIRGVARRAKYLLLDCGQGTLILHLGMSGSLRLLSASSPIASPEKHDHFDLVLENNNILRLTDPRRFGAVLWEVGDITQHRLLARLGPEPLTEEFNGSVLYEKMRGRSASIKEAIMNSRIVVGVGNIYASESLFRAGINPKVAASEVEFERIVKWVLIYER